MDINKNAPFVMLCMYARNHPRPLETWAQCMGGSVPTLQRLEAGDPAVGIGIVATALWLIKRDGGLSQLAALEHDQGAIEMSVREAVGQNVSAPISTPWHHHRVRWAA